MKLDRKDWYFIVAALAVLGFFLVISGKETTKLIPENSTHKIVYDTAFKNAPGPDASIFKRAFFRPDKRGAEVFCEPCHIEQKVPYPPNHPGKNRCLFCHKFSR